MSHPACYTEYILLCSFGFDKKPDNKYGKPGLPKAGKQLMHCRLVTNSGLMTRPSSFMWLDILLKAFVEVRHSNLTNLLLQIYYSVVILVTASANFSQI